MNITSNDTTRRALLGGSAAVLAAALVPSGGEASPHALGRSSERLRRAIRLHDRVGTEYERFDVEVESPALRAFATAIAAYEDEPPPPHEQSATSFVNAFGDLVRLSTETLGGDAVARRVVNDPDWADMGDEDWRQAHREIAAAYDRRDAVVAAQTARKREFEAAMRARFRVDELADRSTALADRRYRLWRAAVETPAATLADVVIKLDFIARTAAEDEMEPPVFAAISADVRRLAGEG